MTHGIDDNQDNREPQVAPRSQVMWYAATGAAVAAIIILAIYAHALSTNLSTLRQDTQAQISKLNDQLSRDGEDSKQRWQSVAQETHESLASVEERTKSELRKTGANLSAKLAKQGEAERAAQEQVTGKLDELRQSTDSAHSQLNDISGDVTSVKGDVSTVKQDVASTQSELHQTGSDLKRVTGDMGVMSGLIATNSKELAQLRELGERDYVEFDLTKKAGPQKVGILQLAVAKTDPKRNRFTLSVLADDKRIEKRDKTTNEPVQFYVSGNRLPYEVVVNEVKKDEVVGYVSVPKVKIARR